MPLSPPTERGRATREWIVRAAARLIAEHRATGTSVDHVIAAARARKSQLYHYFGDKHELREAVVDYQSATVLGFQARVLAAADSWEGLERWADEMAGAFEREGLRGGARSDTRRSPCRHRRTSPRSVESGFITWRHAISGALIRLRDNRLLAADADIEALT